MLIPIKGDPRVPLAEIHALFAGTIQPEDVLKAARKGEPSAEELKQRLFYTHLYLGLYFEAVYDPVKSHEHLLKAANEYRPDDYMGDVAEVHLSLKQAKAAEAK